MLSRLYDERVFTSSDDVVFGTSRSQLLRRNGDLKSRGGNHDTLHKSASEDPQRRGKEYSELEEEEESKSDDERESAVSADDELDSRDEDDDVDDEESRRLKGLKFPLQSPRHISASQSYLHRQRRRQLQQEVGNGGISARKAVNGDVRKAALEDALPLSPTPQRRMAQKLLDGGDIVSHSKPQHTSVTAPATPSHEAAVMKNTFHDRPMELVFLSTGEIRPRDECPPGLKLPLSSMAPVPMLREEEQEEEQEQVKQKKGGRKARRSVKSRRELSSEESSEEELPGNGKANHGERYSQKTYPNGTVEDAPRSRSYRPQAIETRRLEETRTVRKYAGEDDDEQQRGHEVWHRTRHLQRQEESKAEDRSLQGELQKEKNRVLQKMTQLLEEQGKTQALQRKLEMYESKVVAMESELKVCAGREEAIRERDARIQALSEQLRAKYERITRLEEAQIEAARASEQRPKVVEGRQANAKDEDRVARLRQREAALATQLEDLMNRVTAFHTRVETWKANSRDALEGCGKRADVIELMDRLWVDFPPFIADSRNSTRENDGESSTITYLTKKLRQKEEELRATQLKYVELKELCARQCIREADLQNFINEHRLRGNLVIPRPSNIVPQTHDQENQSIRANGHSHARDQRLAHAQQPEDEEEEEEGEVEGGNEGYEDDDEVVVRQPRVFIDIKRADQHRQQSDIEHVRLAPSPGLAHRYREQQQQALQQHGSMKTTVCKKTRSSVAVTSASTSRAATVASASRTLGVTRQATASATARSSATQKRQVRTTSGARSAPVSSRNATATRSSTTSRRLSTQPPLCSRPWV